MYIFMFNRACFNLGRMVWLYVNTRILVVNVRYIDRSWGGVKVKQGITFGFFSIMITRILVMMVKVITVILMMFMKMMGSAWSWGMDNICWG